MISSHPTRPMCWAGLDQDLPLAIKNKTSRNFDTKLKKPDLTRSMYTEKRFYLTRRKHVSGRTQA
jgi:hypothetical protein